MIFVICVMSTNLVDNNPTMRHIILSIAVFIGALPGLPAQPNPTETGGKRTISGVVSEEGGSPLEGVLVSVKGGGSSSGTQSDGQYYIEVPGGDSVLDFSLDGYKKREVRISGSNYYNITLSRSAPFSAQGAWRGVFLLRPGVEVPFNLEIRSDGKAYLHNGDEWFEGGAVRQTDDSLFIGLDQFDNELAFPIAAGSLNGVFRHQDKSGRAIPVRLDPGVTFRFPDGGSAPAGNMSGTYDVRFGSDTEKVVGLFHQEGSRLTGTFLRVTGDARYLEGVVRGDTFYLSSFIGSGPVFFKGVFTSDGHLSGESVGPRGNQAFTGISDAHAALPDPYTLTHLRDGYSAFDFSFPDLDGKAVSLHDPRFAGKVVVITIGGTWCPNCVDEASFLAPWYKTNRARGVEVVSIQYERTTDTAYVHKVLLRMRNKYDIQYTQVFGGIADKKVVAATLPSLNTFLAFPTTILIDRKGRVARIHTGYTGPATGSYYQAFLKEFNTEVDDLLTQK